MIGGSRECRKAFLQVVGVAGVIISLIVYFLLSSLTIGVIVTTLKTIGVMMLSLFLIVEITNRDIVLYKLERVYDVLTNLGCCLVVTIPVGVVVSIILTLIFLVQRI